MSCLNGGSCLDQGNGIRLCQCREGFRGEDCGEATAAAADNDDDDETTTEEVPKARVRKQIRYYYLKHPTFMFQYKRRRKNLLYSPPDSFSNPFFALIIVPPPLSLPSCSDSAEGVVEDLGLGVGFLAQVLLLVIEVL